MPRDGSTVCESPVQIENARCKHIAIHGLGEEYIRAALESVRHRRIAAPGSQQDDAYRRQLPQMCGHRIAILARQTYVHDDYFTRIHCQMPVELLGAGKSDDLQTTIGETCRQETTQFIVILDQHYPDGRCLS